MRVPPSPPRRGDLGRVRLRGLPSPDGVRPGPDSLGTQPDCHRHHTAPSPIVPHGVVEPGGRRPGPRRGASCATGRLVAAANSGADASHTMRQARDGLPGRTPPRCHPHPSPALTNETERQPLQADGRRHHRVGGLAVRHAVADLPALRHPLRRLLTPGTGPSASRPLASSSTPGPPAQPAEGFCVAWRASVRARCLRLPPSN